jgi:hypothetical protein
LARQRDSALLPARAQGDASLMPQVQRCSVRTTVPDARAACPLDRVNRQFKAQRPNQLWVADFTYVSTWPGFVYFAFVVDVFARRIVETMSTWPNRGASGGPCGGCQRERPNPNTFRPSRPDSSQLASSKPGAVQDVPLREG